MEKCTIMKTILFAVLLFLVFSFQITVSSEVPLRLKDAKKLALQGYGSFVNNKYSKAINQFAAVEKYIIKNPRYKKSFDHYYRSYSMITFIQKHRELKLSRNIHKHRVLIIYVKKTDVYYRGRRIQENFTDELIKRARISQNVAKRYYEVLSHGNFTLTFDEHQINSTIRKLKKYTSYKKGKVKPDISSLTPYPHNLFFKAVKNYDTIVIYWPALALHAKA